MMNILYEAGRWFGVITGIPVQWIYFTRKNYYESPNAKTRRHKGAALVIANHYNTLDFVMNVLNFSPVSCLSWRRNTRFATRFCVSG